MSLQVLFSAPIALWRFVFGRRISIVSHLSPSLSRGGIPRIKTNDTHVLSPPFLPYNQTSSLPEMGYVSNQDHGYHQ
uniref:Uncharacterized protein n=1 Tax=Planktothricoides sp. SpSt-374 TaxID=2282167 RepID=A0A7C3ZX98_9CYAN